MKIDKYIYLILAFAGLGWTGYHGALYVAAEFGDASIAGFFADSFTNYAAKSMSGEVWFLLAGFVVFAISEGTRLKMKYIWLHIALSFFALAFAFPLFWYFWRIEMDKDSWQR